jgi:hypothetical protein
MGLNSMLTLPLKLISSGLAIVIPLFPIQNRPTVEQNKPNTLLSLSTPVRIKRVPKANRVKKPSPSQVEEAPLLTLQWQLLKYTNGKAIGISPNSVLKSEDQFRFSIKVNQEGFLYIIYKPEGREGVLVFPDPRVNKGENAVKTNQEYIVPQSCQGAVDPNNCWMGIEPSSAVTNLILIFSRDKIDLFATQPDNAARLVDENQIRQLRTETKQKIEEITVWHLSTTDEGSQFVRRVQNVNPNDNEEIIVTLELKHVK